MIRIRQLTKTFHAGTADAVTALNNVSIELDNDSFVMIAGANGSGKSTFLHLLQGRLFPTSGNIWLDDHDITEWPEHQRSRIMSRVFQDPKSGTAADLTVLENFRLASLRTKSKTLRWGTTRRFEEETTARIASLGLGLEEKLHQKMGGLSGGQRQILTLLMSMYDHPALLLMDEPTAALDPKSAQLVLETTQALHEKYKTNIIMITHALPDALRYGNRLLFFREGNIVKDLQGDEKRNCSLSELHSWFSSQNDHLVQ